jgi:DNA topoisomerase VI subunit B
MSTLIRETFTTSRLSEFCSVKELVNQTGHAVADWPIVILKELLDNVLDGCEESGVAPEVSIIIDANGITVTDNGPGIDAEAVASITDYRSRTSSREAYVSPTRGAQGNALKTILAMPAVLGDGRGTVTIESRSVAHTVMFTVDRIRQEPRIELTQEPCSLANGTKIAVAWPHIACSTLTAARPKILPFILSYAWLNPHASITIAFGGEVGAKSVTILATDPSWSKWKPSDPPSSHWYDVERLSRQMSANIKRAQDRREPCKSVRDFLKEFDSLTSTQRRAAISEAVGVSHLALDQFLGNAIDLRRTGKLLAEMQRHTKPVDPKRLGAIGQAHLCAKLEAEGAEPGTIQYKMATMVDSGIPYLIEAAFGWCPEADERSIVTGINWSVAIGDPFRKLGLNGESLGSILTELECDEEQPIVFALHVACPRIDFLDRGKSAVALPVGPRIAIQNLVKNVTAKWTQTRKTEEKDATAWLRRRDRMLGRREMSQKDAAALVLEEAYSKVSDTGKLPANARQIYYAARPDMLKLTGKTTLGYNYFSQTLLIDFMADNPETCADWDVVWDDRGHFEEPHGGEIVGLGTLAVRQYLAGNHDLEISEAGFADVEIETHGAHGRFGALLFVEKEGFDSLFKSVRLADRYDIGVMSSKGNSVTAARQLADRICADRKIPLFTLHDLDVSGFTIGQIGKDNRRYTYENKIKVQNIGLRLDDILEIEGIDLDDMAERVRVIDDDVEDRGGKLENKREKLSETDATEDEIDFLLGEGEFAEHGSRRIELNALTSRQLVDLVESRLTQHGVTKIVPEAGDLAEAFRAYARAPKIKEAVEKAIEDLSGEDVEVPADLNEQVKDYLDEHPECPWEEAVAAIVEDMDE